MTEIPWNLAKEQSNILALHTTFASETWFKLIVLICFTVLPKDMLGLCLTIFNMKKGSWPV